MLKSLFFGLFGLAATAAAAPQKRDQGVAIYVYGTDINGLAIQSASNGSIYVTTEDSLPSLYNVSVVTADSSTPWAATLSSGTKSLTGYDLYIIPTADSFAAIGFVCPNTTAPSGAVTEGFALFGTYIDYVENSNYISQFWARPTAGSSTTWEILWNSSGDSQDNSVPVSLKTTAPTAVERI